MNDFVQRRLDCLNRHLLPLEVRQEMCLNCVRGGDKEVGGYPVIVGGMILDIHASPLEPPFPRTTTPGEIQYLAGGVARNTAECMSKLGTKPYMISAIGADMAGDILLRYWSSAGLSTEGIRKHQDIKTPVISLVFDSKGELAAGVASVEAVEKFLTPEWIWQSKDTIYSASVLMVDANLNPLTLESSCQLAVDSDVPVWFEPVSVAKSRRIASVAKYVTYASPNEDELIAMANALSCEGTFLPLVRKRETQTVESILQSLKSALLVLLDSGIKVVVLTLGADGVLLCSKDPKLMTETLKRNRGHGISKTFHDIVASNCPSSRFAGAIQSVSSTNLFAVHFPALSAAVVRLTGAGDCLVGGTLASLCSGLDVMQSLAVGIAAAKSAVEAETNVPPYFNLATIADDARLVYAATKILLH